MTLGLGIVALAYSWAEAYPSKARLAIDAPLTYRCGPVARGSFGRHPWVIRNEGARRVKLRTYFTSGRSGFSLWQGVDHFIEPDQSIVVHLTWAAPSDRARAFESYVILKTDDPERTEVRLRVVGTSMP